MRSPERCARVLETGFDPASRLSNLVAFEPEVSWEFDPSAHMKDVAGWSQAGLMEIGAGRLAVIGDNFLVTGPSSLTDSTDQIGIQHPQFTINLFRWLEGE